MEEAGGEESRRAVGGEGKGAGGQGAHAEPTCVQQEASKRPRQGRTRVPRLEMPVRISQGPLSRHQKERRAGVLASRPRQYLSRQEETGSGVTGGGTRRETDGKEITRPSLPQVSARKAAPLIRGSLAWTRIRQARCAAKVQLGGSAGVMNQKA